MQPRPRPLQDLRGLPEVPRGPALSVGPDDLGPGLAGGLGLGSHRSLQLLWQAGVLAEVEARRGFRKIRQKISEFGNLG